ncbi:MAG TPA: hypothetical protein VFB14_01295 [Bryobacteraceae bacterium]|jgi:hypothetical protein|nr:hypothetical protein [Bryobacteraceae bacterium]
MRLVILSLLALGIMDSAMQAQSYPSTTELKQMAAQFAPTRLAADVSRLDAGDRRALVKLIVASRLIDDIFLEQMWSGNLALYSQLKKDASPLGQARLHLFWICKGPWYALGDHRAFLPGVPAHKLPGANFYPANMTKPGFEKWLQTLPKTTADQATGFFTVIRRNPKMQQLEVVPYHTEYASFLQRAAALLESAATDTANTTLRRFLRERAAAFVNDDYFRSDVAWMDLDSPIEITIGPYETYNDELFGYKASFESYVCLRDDAETEKVQHFSQLLQQVENNLPIDPRYRNPKLGATTPIRVVNEIFSAGDGNHGVQTAAFNLPNDERVIAQKGSKKVMLKNVQHAKFDSTLIPISTVVLPAAARADVDFDSFFTHILAHELSHGIGPHEIGVNGRATSVRLQLKEVYSAIEEAKADVTGLFMLQYFFDHGVLPGGEPAEHRLYTTYLASAFRTLRFGITEAHGRGMALQFNYFLDQGAFLARPDGTFAVDFTKVKAAVRNLTHLLMTIEAEGNYGAAQKLLDQNAVIRPVVSRTLERLHTIPVDIEPLFVTAEELSPSQRNRSR